MSRSRQLPLTFRFATLVVALSLVAASGAFPFSSRVASAAPLYTVPSLSVNVPAGGTATISVRAVALAPGATLPAGPLTLATVPLASDRLRTAVYYGIDWGYSESAPGQVALALWQLQDGVWRAQEHTVAERIAVAAAASQSTPSWLPDGSSVLQAITQGQATLSELALAPLADNPAVGAGSLTVTNNSFAAMLLYLPYGTVFSGPSGSVIAWAAPALPGAQVTPTAEPATPTATAVEATATPTTEPPSAPPPSVKGETATATTVPEPTATSRPKGDPPAPAPPTDTPSPEPPSATPTSADTPVPPPSNTPAAQPPAVNTERQSPERQPAAREVETGTSPVTAPSEQPAADAPLPPPGGATQAPHSSQSAPVPVSTSAAAGVAVPQPVATQPGAAIPNPVATTIGTVPPGGQVPPPVASAPVGKQASPSPARTASPSPTVFQKSEATATVAPAEPTPAEVATPAPTPVPIPPTPAPVPPTAVVPPAEGPVINVAPGDGQAGGVAPSTGETSTSGAPQTYNPTTGGGPSPLPIWLGLLSAVMVLGGWGLKRMSTPARARVRAEDEAEK